MSFMPVPTLAQRQLTRNRYCFNSRLEHHHRVHALVQTTALLFASGKMAVTGTIIVRSQLKPIVDDHVARLESRKYARLIQDLVFNASFNDELEVAMKDICLRAISPWRGARNDLNRRAAARPTAHFHNPTPIAGDFIRVTVSLSAMSFLTIGSLTYTAVCQLQQKTHQLKTFDNNILHCMNSVNTRVSRAEKWLVKWPP
jgi:hypothetical protein